MPKVRVDFSQAQDFEAIPAGAYPAVLEETEVRESNSGPYPYINWTFKIVSGDYVNRKQWFMTSVSPKAAGFLKDALKALGETNETIIGKDVKDADIDPDDYLGREVIINVVQETYDNTLRNKVDSLSTMAAIGGSVRRMR